MDDLSKPPTTDASNGPRAGHAQTFGNAIARMIEDKNDESALALLRVTPLLLAEASLERLAFLIPES